MLLIMFGPPAVGKMTIGRSVCTHTGFRLFHNHMTIEPLLETFGYGTPSFDRLNSEFRIRVLEEAANNHVDLLFSIVWALDCEEDRDIMERYIDIFGGDVAFVELRADLDTRLQRNRTEERLLNKASKRDLDWSDSNVREMESQWAMTSENGPHLAGGILSKHPHLVVETSDQDVREVAEKAASWVASIRKP